MRYTLNELMDLATREARGIDVPTRPAILKEMLHAQILHSLSRSALADRLVFQGGTAIAAVYGGQRYSEDLDFVCGADANEPFDLANMEDLLRNDIAERYGLDLVVKSPAAGKSFDDDGITVKRWSFNLMVPGFPSTQRIHFEVCNVPSYDNAVRLIQPRYNVLSDIYSDVALRVESLEEIAADKVVALIARSHLKARDIWDLQWLDERGVRPDFELVRTKFGDYGVDDIDDRIELAQGRLDAPGAGQAFVNEMRRFVTPSAAERLFADPAKLHWIKTASHILGQARDELPRLSP